MSKVLDVRPQMTVTGTPVEYYPNLGLWVKREDLSCPGGPNFSKTRGVWAHVAARNEQLIGVLDTTHSQGGWAVARACALLGRHCRVYYPRLKADEPELRPQQQAAAALGADIFPLQATRSIILWHRARKLIEADGGYMMPNALKLAESVEETALEVERTPLPPVATYVVSVSSGTLAAGVLRGLYRVGRRGTLVLHLGYSRPAAAVIKYVLKMAEVPAGYMSLEVVDEGYQYADKARVGINFEFPSNSYYDLKSARWWSAIGRTQYGSALLWNVG